MNEIEQTALAGLAHKVSDVHRLQIPAGSDLVLLDASFRAHEEGIDQMPYLFLNLCVEGGGHVLQQTTAQRFSSNVRPGTMGFTAPFATGHGKWPKMRVVSIGFSEDLVRVALDGELPSKELLSEKCSRAIHDPFVALTMRELARAPNGIQSQFAVHAARMIVSRIFARSIDRENHTQLEDRAQFFPLSRNALRLVEDYVRQHIHRRISVDELAALVGMSKFHFSHRFRQASGLSPYAFVLRLKMDFAAECLAHRHAPTVTALALDLGYDTPAHFSRAFKQRWGVSPGIWRKNYSQN